jgi:hypothetical protein
MGKSGVTFDADVVQACARLFLEKGYRMGE